MSELLSYVTSFLHLHAKEQEKEEKKVFTSLEEISSCYKINVDRYKKYEKEIVHLFNGGEDILPNNAQVALNMLGNYELLIKENNEKAIKFYTESSDLGNPYASFNLGDLYYKMNKIDESKKYFSLSIDQGHDRAINYLATLYELKEHNLEKAEKYYKMSVAAGDILGTYNYSVFLYHRDRKEEAKVYFKRIVLYGIDDIITKSVLNNVIDVFTDIELYNILSTSLPVKDHLKNEWSRLLNKPTVNAYINKINTFKRLNNYNTCNICFEEKLNINYACGHEVCVDCYARLNGKCHFCKR
jgi:tetratricopeptide (TPR) repeat protein